MELVKADERLHRLYKIITSVDGVGMVTALHMPVIVELLLSNILQEQV